MPNSERPPARLVDDQGMPPPDDPVLARPGDWLPLDRKPDCIRSTVLKQAGRQRWEYRLSIGYWLWVGISVVSAVGLFAMMLLLVLTTPADILLRLTGIIMICAGILFVVIVAALGRQARREAVAIDLEQRAVWLRGDDSLRFLETDPGKMASYVPFERIYAIQILGKWKPQGAISRWIGELNLVLDGGRRILLRQGGRAA